MPFKPQLYKDYRAAMWEKQGRYSNVDLRASKLKDGSPLDKCYLAPKPILFYKDVWHCPDTHSAKVLIRKITFMKDVNLIEMKGTWVYIDYANPTNEAYSHLLPGQSQDDRKRLRK